MPRTRTDPSLARRAFATMGGLAFVAALFYGAVCYAGRFGVPNARHDSGAPAWRIATNAVLFLAFALHHSICARAGPKAWIAARVTPALERSVYVWISSALFALMFAAWQPLPGVVWHLQGLLALAGYSVQVLGVAGTALASLQLGVLQLSGLQPVTRDRPPVLDATGWYGLVRHPIYLAWFLMVWGAPVMTATRAEFALLTCLYLIVAVPYEEQDLIRIFGDAYRDYRRRVRWRIVPFVY